MTTHQKSSSSAPCRLTAARVEAVHQMPIEPHRVHVIPPNHDMVIERGALSLSVLSIEVLQDPPQT